MAIDDVFGSYPTTAETQLADKAAVAAEAGAIVSGVTILGVTGSYPTTASTQAAQLATDRAAVLASASYIVAGYYILGQAGTYTGTGGTPVPSVTNTGTCLRPS